MDKTPKLSQPLGLSLPDQNKVEEIFRTALPSKSYQVSFFGSRSRGDYRQYSDLDLYVVAKPTLLPDELSTVIEALQESDLAFKVDVVTPETLLEAYRLSVEKELKPWFRSQLF